MEVLHLKTTQSMQKQLGIAKIEVHHPSLHFSVPVDKLDHLFQRYLCYRNSNTQLTSQACGTAKVTYWFLKVFLTTVTL